jgi:integrase
MLTDGIVILFLYIEVLGIHLTGINALRAKKDKHLPVVLTKAEVHRVLEQITDPIFRLQAKLLYGTGMVYWNVCVCESKISTSANI